MPHYQYIYDKLQHHDRQANRQGLSVYFSWKKASTSLRRTPLIFIQVAMVVAA